MSVKSRWGILGVSNFAARKIVPAVRSCEETVFTAIASRDLARAKQAATAMEIAKAYGSYEELLADPDVDVIYNPLPNHMHVPWSIRAAKAGKHVLCEKPVSLSTADLRSLIAARDEHRVLIAEAFMIRFHPQWLRVVELIRSGAIGPVRAVSTCFSYFNRSADNVRNIADYGGGGMWDIGCYAVNVARLVFGAEPVRTMALLEKDPDFQTDRLASGILEFPGGGQCVFVCSTQMVPYQKVQIFGSQGRIEVEIPFNAPPGEGMRIFIDNGADVKGSGIRIETVDACDQYTLQADSFTRATRGAGPLVNSLEDTFGNTATLEALLLSAASGGWQAPVQL